MTCSTKSAGKRPDFRFPFKPYQIQQDFAQALFECIDAGQIGIFESPTGTGKSLSIACGAMAWMQHYESTQLHRTLNTTRIMEETTGTKEVESKASELGIDEEENEPDWVVEQDLEEKKRGINQKIQQQESLAAERRRRAQEHDAEIRRLSQKGFKRTRVPGYSNSGKSNLVGDSRSSSQSFGKKEEMSHENEEDLLLADPGSGSSSKFHLARELAFLSGGNIDLLDPSNAVEGDANDVVWEEGKVRIFYCSRTHSQLSQFTQELRKTSWSQSTTLIPLGSRKTSCIHEPLKAKYGVGEQLNEACLDFQHDKSRTGGGRCPYMVSDDAKSLDMRDYALGGVHDIEELVLAGRSLRVCPYYASRQAYPQAEIITLPYNILLQKSARDAMGLKLQDQVVIIDEAHNLVETISSTYSSSLSLSQLQMVQKGLRGYLSKYQRRLSPKNATNVRLLLVLLNCMVESLEGWRDEEEKDSNGSKVINTNGFLNRCGIESINLMHMCTFLHESKLARKLHSFTERSNMTSPEVPNSLASDKTQERNRTTSDVHAFQSFLFSLADSDADGRVILVHNKVKEAGEDVSLQYILLNPADRFKSIVQEARSVVLAGGTMGSVELLRQHLFPYVNPDRFRHFTCGHVVPEEAVLTIALGSGPSGKDLHFTHTYKQDTAMMDDLGSAIVNFCNLVPAGVVCFFPSYAYLETVWRRWEQGITRKRLESRKKVFVEVRGGDISSMLSEYTQAIKQPTDARNGAILFSVVGGRLSEGINFSDHLARAVIQVGLPFADLHSVELKEKLRYLDASSKALEDKERARETSTFHMGPQATAYYENLCMRSVNQSIGRAIRHQGDYACIILLDARFSNPHFIQMLPTWLGKRVHQAGRFGQAVGEIAQFFRKRRALQDTFHD